MNNFIVPVDFSVDSLKGLEWALLFSQYKTINIQMVYVLTNGSNFQSRVVEEEQKFAQDRFEKLIKEYTPRLKNDSKLRYIIKKGKVYREIVNQVNSYKQAVVSTSTHGASGFEELFIGSNAMKVIAATNQPVFTLRKERVPTSVKRIVVPIKRSRDTRQKAPIAAEMAKLFGAELHVLSISTSENQRDLARIGQYARQVEGYFNARELKTVSKTMVGDSLSTLTVNYAESVNADMIVIMSAQVDKWNAFLGSFAQQMINKSNVPLLNITPRKGTMPPGFANYGG
ncbi:MAG: universal stress protein [Bacteroidales bacterium]